MRLILNGMKILIKIALLCLIAIGVVLYCSAALRIKKVELPNDTSNKVAGFYALEENSMDVLFLGTSHSYYAFNPGVFYEKTGLNSYVFAGECQPIGVTYYYFIEALKTQKPKIVVLDLFSLLPSSQGCQTNGIIQKNLEDLKISENKFKAFDLLDNEEERFNAKFDLMLYRNRWSEMEDEEWDYPLGKHFNPTFGYTLGWPKAFDVFERPVYSTSEQLAPIENQFSYLERIISLANENEIDLILFKTPFYENIEDFKTMNMLQEFARLHDIPFLDMNLNYSLYNFQFDADGDMWHCNARGGVKVTQYLSDYINQNYSISSANNELYKKDYENLYLQTLKTLLWSSCYTIEQLINLIDYTDLTLIVSNTVQENWSGDLQSWQKLHEIGIDLPNLFDYNYVAVISDGKMIDLTKSKEEFEYNDVFKDHYLYFNSSYENHTYLDDKNMTLGNDGINVIIIDNATSEILALVCIDSTDYYSIIFKEWRQSYD